MTKFDHPDYADVSLTCKAKPNVRDILMYDGCIEVGTMTGTLYTRLWSGVKWLVKLDKWECEQVKPDADIQEIMNGAADMKTIEIIKWAALAVFSF